jgi:hypothetical protein
MTEKVNEQDILNEKSKNLHFSILFLKLNEFSSVYPYDVRG